jgi:hypothetical protein
MKMNWLISKRTTGLFAYLLIGFFISFIATIALDSSTCEAEEEPPLPVEDYDVIDHEWAEYPRFYIEDYDTTHPEENEKYKKAVKNALNDWVQACALAWIVNDADDADVTVEWVEDYNDLEKPYNNENNVGTGSKKKVQIVKKDDRGNLMTDTVVDDIARHEFGHVWGLGHSEDEEDVMYKTVITEIEDCGCYAVGPSLLTDRDKKMLDHKFKGLEGDFEHKHQKSNAKPYAYSYLTPRFGDLKKVETQYSGQIVDEEGIPYNYEEDPLTHSFEVLKNGEPNRDSHTVLDIDNIETIQHNLWVNKACHPKDDPKNPAYEFMKKFYTKIEECNCGGSGSKCDTCHPPPHIVGGTAVPVNKYALLASWIGLALVLLSATVATATYIRYRKKKQETLLPR